MSEKKKDLLSSAMKRTSEWISSQEVSSDVTVHIREVSFSLHKFPLLSKCGLIKKLVSESNKDSDPTVIEIPDIPGGSEAFELAAKFCYGINFDMSTENIAMLRCAAECLEMTEEHSVENLVVRTEAYLNEIALKSLSSSITVLHKTEDLLPIAERVKLVSRCIDAIAYMTCQESQFCSPSFSSNNSSNVVVVQQQGKQPVVDWWAEDLTILRIDLFQRVLIAMMARGFKQYGLGPVLMLFAQKSLRGLEIFGKGMKKIEPKQEHEKRVILETIVSLLPREKNAMSVSFLSMLLRAAIYLETTVACRLDLEKRMGLQLSQAVLDDLLIPSYSFTGEHSLFDTDTVQRVLMNYLEFEVEGVRLSNNDGVYLASDMERIGKLMENYLAEVASDRNVSLQRFMDLAELIPEQTRVTEDGMYRAVDIYLKAHPNMSDVERKKVCSLMDCQKLSREACAHAAQNDRLPVQTIVQVLYYEQQRLRGQVNNDSDSPAPPSQPPPPPVSAHVLPPKLSSSNDELSKLKRENQDLKLELLKMKMKLKEIEKEKEKKSSSSTTSISSNQGSPISTASMDKPPLPKKSFINSVSRKLGKLNPFGIPPYNGRSRTKPPKDRRHSIS
ncbi:unnamed protein product [Cochlearia groenlandica]